MLSTLIWKEISSELPKGLPYQRSMIVRYHQMRCLKSYGAHKCLSRIHKLGTEVNVLCKNSNILHVGRYRQKPTLSWYPRSIFSFTSKQESFNHKDIDFRDIRKYSQKLGFEWYPIYRFPYMRHLRFISRLKFYQLLIMTGLCVPLYNLKVQELITSTTFYGATTACVGTSLILIALSYLSTRVVGLLSYNELEQTVKVSRLSFLGSKIEERFSVNNIIPWEDDNMTVDTKKAIQRLYIYSGGEKPEIFLYSLKHGAFMDRELFANILGIPL